MYVVVNELHGAPFEVFVIFGKSGTCIATTLGALATAISIGLRAGISLEEFTKRYIGHTCETAGLAGLLKAILAMRHGIIPPAANFQNPSPEIDLERLPSWSFRQRHEFTRALAVVVAHELQHLAGAGHAPEGLMATALGARQLRDRELEVDARLTPEFRAALAAPASPER
jgi:hypothetical protein